MFHAQLRQFTATVALGSLLLQACKSSLNATVEEPLLKSPCRVRSSEQTASQALVVASGEQSTDCTAAECVDTCSLRPLADASLSGSLGSLSASSSRPTLAFVQVSKSPCRALDMPNAQQSLYGLLTAASGSKRVTFGQVGGQHACLPTVDTTGNKKKLQRARVQLRNQFSNLKLERRYACIRSDNSSRALFLSYVFGAEAWKQYLGEVGVEPALPDDIDEILYSPCPFWPGERVRDTHLLVLVPSAVDGKPFTLNLLEKLVDVPKRGEHNTQYSIYDNGIQCSLGNQSFDSSYWVLMTRDTLLRSRVKTYTAQKELIFAHAHRMGIPYRMPHVLEAATVILSHYVRTGERLYAHDPWTYTRCQDVVADDYQNECSIVVGGFFDEGLCISTSNFVSCELGASGLRTF
ncbi:MAG: hypothetical protein MUC61_00895 [Amoebophilaceae bacterium]|jgi:hypothetical protein|nr:hypothetical protein [Amoebophilaceae bacterium]